MKMKILLHVHGYPPHHNAGAEWMVHHMMKWLQAKGHEILVAAGDAKEHTFEGIPVIPEYGKIHVINHYVWADIVVSHLNRVGKVINNIRRPQVDGMPALFIKHNTHRYSAIQKIAHRSILCYNSEYTKQVGLAFYGHKESCIVQPPCPVDYYKTNRGGASHVTLINHCELKGSEMFFNLAKALPDVKFMAVKGGYYHQEKQKMANVTYKENTPKIQKAYERTKILLMPSEYESFGRTAIEAAASGIPTIANPTDGLLESLGEAGIFHPLDNQQAWEDEIKKLLEDKDYYKERSDAARKRAAELEELFDPQMEVLQDLMIKAIKGRTK